MKRIFTTLLLLLPGLLSVTAQSFSVSLTGGYCAPLASNFFTKSEIEFQNIGFPAYYTTQQNLVRTSYGQGGNVAFAFDWFSKYNIGCGLKLNAMISSPFTSAAQVSYQNGTSANFTFHDKPFSFQFIPHISFKHDYKVVSPVLEMGMIVGITNITEDYTAINNSNDVIQSTINNHGGALLGFYSSLGIAIRVARSVRIMVAVNCSAGSYSPTVWDRVSYTYDGQDQMQYLSTSSKQGIFVKQIDQTASQSSSQPHQQLKYSVPFSSVGINTGLSFLLQKKTKAVKKEKREDTY